jgi:hypothetical protein
MDGYELAYHNLVDVIAEKDKEIVSLKESLEAAVNVITSIASLVEWAQRWKIPFTISVMQALREVEDERT